MIGLSGKTVLVVGAGGSQGRMAVDMLERCSDRPQALVALDRGFDPELMRSYAAQGVRLVTVDILDQRRELESVLAAADLALNFAGPFHLLGTAVLDAAIAAGCDYVDICDDARIAGVHALAGAGSAPGITNVLGRLALNNLPPGTEPAQLEIAWVTPVEDLSPAIFQHIQHCLRTVGGEPGEMPRWPDLEPRQVEFPAPIGEVETILFGHPEPFTFRESLGINPVLRGGSMPSEMMHIAWSLSSIVEQSRREGAEQAALAEAFQSYRAAGRAAALPQAQRGWGGLRIEAARGLGGVRIQTVSNETMEETTVTPCLSFARVVVNGQLPGAGVFAPETIAPRDFFAAGRANPATSSATTRLFAQRADAAGAWGAVGMGELLAAPQFAE